MLSETLADPAGDFMGVPTDCAQTDALGCGEAPLFHQVVQVRAFETGDALDFVAAQDTPICGRGFVRH